MPINELNETMEQVANYSAIPLALIGFGLTLWQLAKTKRAAEAAQESARSAQVAISRNHLLILIPQLQRIEEELERSVRANSIELTLSWLANWRWQAGQLRGFLLASSYDDEKTMRALQSSIAKAAVARKAIIDSKHGDLLKATRPARDAIAVVTNELGMLAAHQGIKTGGQENGSL